MEIAFQFSQRHVFRPRAISEGYPAFSFAWRLVSVTTLGWMLDFRPKLFDALRGYNRATFLSDLAAGVTVRAVAFPLAIGFGIASRVEPPRRLSAAIIAGFVISALVGRHLRW